MSIRMCVLSAQVRYSVMILACWQDRHDGGADVINFGEVYLSTRSVEEFEQ